MDLRTRKGLVTTLCLGVAALHLVTGPRYSGPFKPFVTGHLMDLALPLALVPLSGIGAEQLGLTLAPWIRALGVFSLGGAVELCQGFGIPLFGRTFDPLDLLMYALGAALGLGVEWVMGGPETPPCR